MILCPVGPGDGGAGSEDMDPLVGDGRVGFVDGESWKDRLDAHPPGLPGRRPRRGGHAGARRTHRNTLDLSEPPRYIFWLYLVTKVQGVARKLSNVK